MPTTAPTTIGLVQINSNFSGQSYLPYAVGLLESYVRAHAPNPDRYRFLTPVYSRIPVRDAVGRLGPADIVGFSVYVWNFRISLEIARRLKAKHPETLIVFGGPHVPEDATGLLTDKPFIDVAVHGEGERTFLKLLEASASRRWQDVPGISFRAGAKIQRNPTGERIRDLDEIPSPFLDGTFDRLMAAEPEMSWIGLWETNRGCPFSCTFCDWGSATAAKVNKFGMDRLKAEIDWFSRQKIEFIFCCDANFGILPRDLEIARAVGEIKTRTGFPKALSVQNTKNARERAYATQKLLADFGLNKGVALSMQSVDSTTLANIKRDNISLDNYFDLQKRFNRDRIETFSDLILGLPGETYESFVSGTMALIESGQHNRIQFNNCSLLPNAEMAAPAYRQKFGIKTVFSPIINIHGRRQESEDDVVEEQELVVACDSLPPDDWRRTRAFAWMTAFLHFDKLLQMPLVIARTLGDVPYRDMVEAFLNVDAADYPLLGQIRDFFLATAADIQGGGDEYIYSSDWLGIYWPADEFLFIKLTVDDALDQFYGEAEHLLQAQLARAGGDGAAALSDAVKLNRLMLKRPAITTDIECRTRYDILGIHRAVLTGEAIDARPIETIIKIDRTSEQWSNLDDWCRQVVWWGNKKGAYLYGARALEPQLAGHF